MEIEKELFELMFELEDIEEVQTEKEYKNTYDISVTGSETFLLSNGIVSHNSAKSALLPGLGRKGLGYYELKGKPLNAYSSSHSKFVANKELTELYNIIKNEGYTKIAIASDADLDGIAINGLMIAFFKTYLESELKEGLLYRLNTPVGISKKGKKVTDWVYNIKDMHLLKGEVKYMKGLGSWSPEQMKAVLEKDGIDNMLVQLEHTESSSECIDDWYSKSKADTRKERIMANESFSIIKL